MAQPLGKTDSSSASEDVSAASPLASWLSHLGLPRSSATQYAVLLGDAGAPAATRRHAPSREPVKAPPSPPVALARGTH